VLLVVGGPTLALGAGTFIDVVGGALVGAGDGACPADDTAFVLAALLVMGFDPEQNSQAQSPLSFESPSNHRR